MTINQTLPSPPRITFLVNQLKTMRTCSLGTLALIRIANTVPASRQKQSKTMQMCWLGMFYYWKLVPFFGTFFRACVPGYTLVLSLLVFVGARVLLLLF
jgi:hypothetical protein